MKPLLSASALLLCLFLQSAPCCSQTADSAYHIIDSLRLGGDGGWDYLLADTVDQRLYVSRGMRVQVVDLRTLTVTGEIQNTPGVHGVALDHATGKGYTSNGRDSSVTVFDLATLKTLGTIRVHARNPDAILYDPSSKRIFTFNGGSASATAIDAASGSVVGLLPLPGKPEFAVTDGAGRVFVNLEDKNQVAAFDPLSLKVLGIWSLDPGEEPSGLAIDRQRNLLFSVCRNRLMVVLDARSGQIVSTSEIGSGVDGAAFDPETRLAFSSNGEGTLSVAGPESSGKYALLQTVRTRPGARTLALDEKSHRIFTVTAKFGPAPPPTPERPRPRPVMEPGTATLYVLGR